MNWNPLRKRVTADPDLAQAASSAVESSHELAESVRKYDEEQDVKENRDLLRTILSETVRRAHRRGVEIAFNTKG